MPYLCEHVRMAAIRLHCPEDADYHTLRERGTVTTTRWAELIWPSGKESPKEKRKTKDTQPLAQFGLGGIGD
jgi:hypothetical protein